MIVRVLTFLILAFGAVAASGAEALQWKFVKGDVFYLEEVMKQSQTIQVAGQTQKSSSTQTTITSFQVLDTQPDKGADLEMVMLSVKRDGAANELSSRMEGARFQVGLDSRNQITSFKGYDEFVKRVAAGQPQAEAIFRSILSEDSFKKMVTQTFTVVPNRSVQTGDTWAQELTLSLGPFGQVAVTRRLTHAGTDTTADGKKLVRLDLKGTAKYSPPKERFPGLPFEVADGNLKFDGITGQGSFDPVAGRLVQMKANLHLNGTLTIKVAGQETDATLDQVQQVVVRLLDKNPAGE